MGHLERHKTYDLVQRDYYWPGKNIFIKNYIEECVTCQTTKNQLGKQRIPTIPIELLHIPKLFKIISMDFIIELPESNRINAILVIVDQGCTKTTILILCTTYINAEETVWKYAYDVFRQFEVSQKIIFNRGPQFNSKFIKELCLILRVDQNLSTAYHPQTNSQMKRMNQELEQYLCAFCNIQQDNWQSLLPFTEFTHNLQLHSTINTSLFNTLMGYNPRFSDIQPQYTSNPTVKQWIQQLKRL